MLFTKSLKALCNSPILDMALLYDKLGYKDLSEEKYREAILLEENDARAYYGLGVLYDEDG
ncbi:hypothetical protein GNF51_15115, partial [Clostridium perfringens]|nr:hypothetical protein [Clostridium perfringens]